MFIHINKINKSIAHKTLYIRFRVVQVMRKDSVRRMKYFNNAHRLTARMGEEVIREFHGGQGSNHENGIVW